MTTRTKSPLVGWAILFQSSNRTPSVTRSVLAKRPLPTAFPGRPGRGSSLRTHHRCRHRQVSGDAGESTIVSGGRLSNSTSDDAGGGDVLCHSTSRPSMF